MPEWVRVKDKTTGHTYDLPAGAVEAYGDGIEVVKDAKPNVGEYAEPRPAEYSTRRAGAPAEKKESAR